MRTETPMTSTLVTPAAKKRRPPNAGKGRIKGVPNKTTASVKAALVEAFDNLGGVPALVTWAKESPAEFYKLWGRMLPLEVSGPDGAPIQVQAQMLAAVANLTPEERAQLRTLMLKLEGVT